MTAESNGAVPIDAKPAPRRRRHDPHRRLRIATAAVAIITREGVTGLSHRAVAKEADVPLASTTYHFSDLNELMAAALELISDHEIQVLEEWYAKWDLEHEMLPALVDLLVTYTGDLRELSKLEYEIHVLAFRRPIMNEAADRWAHRFTEMLGKHVPAQESEVIVTMMDGLMINNLVGTEPISAQWARRCLMLVLTP